MGGISIEVYFSPTDGVNAKLLQAIQSANVDLYFGIYSFTLSTDAQSIINRIQNNVYTAGIIDPTSSSYAPYTLLSTVMGANLIKDNITGLYHNKMLIVDPSAPDSDPMVLTGSFNWSTAADTKNDENVVIIHNAAIANIYYQAFYQNFTDEGGTLVEQSVINAPDNLNAVALYPNPCSEYVTVKISDPSVLNNSEITLFNIIGREMFTPLTKNNDSFILDTSQLTKGLYFLQFKTNNKIEISKLQVIK